MLARRSSLPTNSRSSTPELSTVVRAPLYWNAPTRSSDSSRPAWMSASSMWSIMLLPLAGVYPSASKCPTLSAIGPEYTIRPCSDSSTKESIARIIPTVGW